MNDHQRALQRRFNAFDKRIRLTTQQKKFLREKRDLLQQELKVWLRTNKQLSAKFIAQGSFPMNTAIQPLGDDDYDIDIGLLLDDLDTRTVENPVEVKEWVRTAFSRYRRKVFIKEPCVQVQYEEGGRKKFHIDLAVYGLDSRTGNRQMARGKVHSRARYRSWQTAAPEMLRDKLKNRFPTGAERDQFKRVIRYLKRWKDVNFSKVGHARPPGIALTGMAYRWFQPRVSNYRGEKAVDDLGALIQLLKSIRRHRWGLDITLPVPPGNSVLEKLQGSRINTERYKEVVDQLFINLDAAYTAKREDKALWLLRRVFGQDFY